MAIPNEMDRRSAHVANHLTRIFVFLLGVGAVVWGLFILPVFWQQASARWVAAKILQGETFKPQVLIDAAQQVDKAAQSGFCNPDALHSRFVLRLFSLQESITGANPTVVHSSYAPLYAAAGNALACAPADSFAWLSLFWMDAGRHGLDARNANFLRLSYDLSPNEAWIALWRSQLAMLLFEQLAPDLASKASEEFVKLVNTDWFYWQTAVIFKNASSTARNRVLEQLKSLKLSTRQAFAKALREQGLNVAVPGVERPARPWE